ALKRREAFRNLTRHLETIKKAVRKLDPKAEIFLFGSVAEKRYNYSSDIDILIITRVNPANVHLELWKAGIKEPFEIHVQHPEKFAFYRARTTFIKV
ncbi:MAG: nucleotidyltransferase domain-containing protein, partial [Candidatus Bathyarchaeales archaeon]